MSLGYLGGLRPPHLLQHTPLADLRYGRCVHWRINHLVRLTAYVQGEWLGGQRSSVTLDVVGSASAHGASASEHKYSNTRSNTRQHQAFCFLKERRRRSWIHFLKCASSPSLIPTRGRKAGRTVKTISKGEQVPCPSPCPAPPPCSPPMLWVFGLHFYSLAEHKHCPMNYLAASSKPRILTLWGTLDNAWLNHHLTNRDTRSDSPTISGATDQAEELCPLPAAHLAFHWDLLSRTLSGDRFLRSINCYFVSSCTSVYISWTLKQIHW